MTQTVLITSPLEQVHVERIRALDRNVQVLYAPELLPRTRYISDHHGAPFERSPPQQERFHSMMAEADILWDLPTTDDLEVAAKLRWCKPPAPVSARPPPGWG